MMRAVFTQLALVNYASMVERYGDIYVNEYGQVSRSGDSHAVKYDDERRKVPPRSCMFVHLHRNNFPKSVEELDAMFLEQTLKRNDAARQEKEAGALKRMPDVVVADGGAFERLTGASAGSATGVAGEDGEECDDGLDSWTSQAAKPMSFTPAGFATAGKDDVPVSHPDVIMPAVKKPAGVKK
jgi:hypothetical protein